MIGLGISIGETTTLQLSGPVFRTPAVANLLRPGPTWAGSPGSGFASAPADPVRMTAKPILRLVTAPLATITGEAEVGAMAVANDGGTLIGGIDRVRFHFEGSTIDVLTPTHRTFTRRDGTTYRQLGYWATLKKPTGTEGIAHLYVEAIPADATMQSRVIGPYRYFLYDTEFTHQITLNPALPTVAGENYQDLRLALNYLRGVGAQRSRILGFGPTHTLFASSLSGISYLTGQSCVIEWAEPVVITQTDANKGDFRCGHSGVIFRGSNITFDMRYIARFFHEATAQPTMFDRVRFTNSGGRDALWNKGVRPISHTANTTNAGGPWFIDCAFDQTHNSAMQNANLVRGCILNAIGGDTFNMAGCVSNTIVVDIDSNAWRTEINALTVQGPAGSTLSLSGSNDATTRIFTARVGVTTVGTFNVLNSSAAFTAGTNYNVANVVAWINSLAGWSATLLNDTRRATALSLQGSTGEAFTNLDVSTPKTLTTQFDIHPDWWQGTGPAENVLAMNNIGREMVCQQMQLNLYTFRDMAFINNAWTQKVAEIGNLNSNLTNSHSHVIIAHNTSLDQSVLIRRDLAYTGDAYCLIANNALRGASDNAAGGAEITADNHYLSGSTGYTGEFGSTFAGTRDDLVVNIANGDFSPSGAMLLNRKAPVWRWDLFGNERALAAPAGAVA